MRFPGLNSSPLGLDIETPMNTDTTTGMWKVGEVQPTVSGVARRLGFGFVITDVRGRPLVSMSYQTEEEAEKAHALVEQAIENAIDIM
jgi:hypothetical protein